MHSFVYKALLTLGLMGGCAFSFAQELNSLNFVTEAYPPYNFKEKGSLQGIAVDLLTSASEKAGKPVSAKDIRVLPWPRAYKMAEQGPGVVLFSTTRTEQREASFQWVGPISPTRVVLLTKKGSGVKIQSADDIKKYTIGAILDDIGEQLVKAAGVPNGKIKRIPKAQNLAKMLNGGRIQAWAYEENVARWFLKQQGYSNDDFETAYVLKESELYYTFSKDVEKDVVDQLQKAIDDVKSSGDYDKIKAKYL